MDKYIRLITRIAASAVRLQGLIAPTEPCEAAKGDNLPVVGQGRLDLIGEIDCRLGVAGEPYGHLAVRPRRCALPQAVA